MRFYLISDNVDTQMGMRLAGIDGVVVHEREEVLSALEKAVNDEDIAVILITEKLMKLCKDVIYEMKLSLKKPLISEIPDRHGESMVTDSISQYVHEAIGIKI